MAVDQFQLTRVGYEALQHELQTLEADYQERFAEFADANSDTDPAPEEGAYFDARTRKEQVEEQIGHIKLVLEHANVMDEDPNPKGVDPGERVTVWDFEDNQERVFNLVSSEETIIARDELEGDEAAVDSPVGQALLGKSVGDVFEVDVPDGKVRYAVRRIERIDG